MSPSPTSPTAVNDALMQSPTKKQRSEQSPWRTGKGKGKQGQGQRKLIQDVVMVLTVVELTVAISAAHPSPATTTAHFHATDDPHSWTNNTNRSWQSQHPPQQWTNPQPKDKPKKTRLIQAARQEAKARTRPHIRDSAAQKTTLEPTQHTI